MIGAKIKANEGQSRMGIYDRDWYKDHNKKSAYSLPESVKDARTSRIRNRFSQYSSRHAAVTNRQYGTLANVSIWMGILGLILAFFYWREAPTITVTGGIAQVTVPKATDGHYYVDGQINGAKVRFLIDTGASYIAVSTTMASRLGLLPDRSATFNTANGRVLGQIASRQSVTVAGLVAPPMSVSIMPSLNGEALLGQNFLSHVTMTQAGQFLVLRGTPHSGVLGRFDSRTKWAFTIGVGLILLGIGVRRIGRN